MNKVVYKSDFKLVFSLNEIVLEYCNYSSVKYCVRNNLLFKCNGGFKDYKKQQYVPMNWKILSYVNLQCSQELKDLAIKMGVPVLHNRKIKKLKVGFTDGDCKSRGGL